MKRYSLLLFVIYLLCACNNQAPKTIVVKKNDLYLKAFDYLESNKSDSAFLYFNKAKDLFLLQKDSLGAGKCLVNMGIIATDKGDFSGGQEIALSAISYFDEKNEKQHPYINSNYNNLGIATYRLENYERAIQFYDLAMKFTNEATAVNLCLNNKASAYQELKQYQKALNIYDQILKNSTQDSINYAMVLNNIAYAKWLQNPNFNPEPDLLKALQIREKAADLFGKNSSYSTLADYYAKKNQALAFSFAKKMFQVANQTHIPYDKLQALQKLVRLSDLANTKQYFEVYKKLDDSLTVARNLAKNRFALIRYESEKNKSDNLILLKDNTDKKYQIIKRDILLYSSLFILLAGTIATGIWYKKKREKTAIETQNTIRENQLKISKKVHDVVANGLYRVMAEIENRPEIDKENLLDKIEYMYERSRDISYEEPKLNHSGFSERIAEMIHSFVASNVTIQLIGNTSSLWQNVSETKKHEIEHVLQELMVNMDKHSKANQVTLQFEQEAQQIYIHYTDNGIGLAKNTTFKNGLSSTGNRIKNIFGTITFEQQNEKGLEIHISFPVS